MLLGDLLTIRQRKLPVKIVVYNNGSLGFVELEMKAAGLLDFGTEPRQPELRRHGARHGPSRRARRGSRRAGERVEGGVRASRPAVVDVVVNRQELAMPPTITAEQAKGFTLYMLKAVMSGRGDEVLDLAKTNLWR